MAIARGRRSGQQPGAALTESPSTSGAAAAGRFITLEGSEGSGKTTAARHLAAWLRGRGIPTLITHEPGGTPLGEEVRRLVLHLRDVSDELDPRADALLFAAGRAQHTARIIRPTLHRGEWVVSARYADSSLAYQGYGYGNDLDALRRLQAFATYGLRPHMTIVLDIPVEVGLQRKRPAEWNRFEDGQDVEFFERVRKGYLALAAAEPDRVWVIDAAGSVEQTDQHIRDLVASQLVPD